MNRNAFFFLFMLFLYVPYTRCIRPLSSYNSFVELNKKKNDIIAFTDTLRQQHVLKD